MSTIETATGVQTPRIFSAPDYVSSTGQEAIELAAMAGLELDEWQRLVLEHALGERRDGKWAAFEVGVTVSRQNGKGGIIEARELAGLFLLGDRLIIHTAHLFDTSLEAFRRLLALIEDTPEFDRRVMRVSRAHGEEGIELKGGQRIRFRTRTKGGGRGFTGDTLIYDEDMILPEAMHSAVLPTLSARPNPQVWYFGSAVDQEIHEHGVVKARVRQRGIVGAPRLVYAEWSVPRPVGEDKKPLPLEMIPDAIAGDPGVWAQGNPALGIRITEEYIADERATLSPRGFAVERLGMGDWPATDGTADSVIKVADWDDIADTKSKLRDPVCLALDVSPDRASASIAVAGRRKPRATDLEQYLAGIDGPLLDPNALAHVEVIANKRGTGWIVAELKRLQERWEPVGIAVDGAGQAASFVPEIERELGIEVRVLSAKEYANACGNLFDRVEQKTLRHLGTNELRNAIKGAVKRALGDAWAWSRKNSNVDITSLCASTIALWGSENIELPAASSWRPV